MDDSAAHRLVNNLTGETPFKATRIRAGRNSRVFQVDCESQRTLLVKFYLQPTADRRSRLEQEWSALQFLTESGLTNVPSPLGFDESKQGAVYSYISGDPLQATSEQDIASVVAFIAKLKEISIYSSAAKITSAAEACFTPAQLVENIEQRLHRLQDLPADDELYQRMHSFLNNKFSVEFEKSTATAKHIFHGRLWTEELPYKFRTLSPSDFGFHNALRVGEGLAFVDFEYFGWDDPVKATSDFLLHPAMNLSKDKMQIFWSGMQGIFSDDSNFTLRFRTYLPLFRLKWCMIILNEFINQHIERREFAGAASQHRNELRAEQLEKAEIFINKDQEILSALNFPPEVFG